jgi:hypothetical protein
MPTTLEKVMTRKKSLAKAHPSWDNSRLLTEAWKPFKGKVSGVKKKKAAKKRKVSGVKKKAAPKRRSVAGTKKRPSGSRAPSRKKVTGIGAIKQQARAAKKDLEDALGREMVKQYKATTKTAKRKVGKKVAEIKKSINSVNKIISKK